MFPTIVELIDFELQLESDDYEIDRKVNTITGIFSDREIELAVNVYMAKVTELTDV
jgi:hypothetical protein